MKSKEREEVDLLDDLHRKSNSGKGVSGNVEGYRWTRLGKSQRGESSSLGNSAVGL